MEKHGLLLLICLILLPTATRMQQLLLAHQLYTSLFAALLLQTTPNIWYKSVLALSKVQIILNCCRVSNIHVLKHNI